MKIGQKVVYVDDSPCRVCGESSSNLNTGSVYVIQNTIEELGTIGLYLVGQPSPSCHKTRLPIAYVSTRFRLLDEMKKEAGERASQDALLKAMFKENDL